MKNDVNTLSIGVTAWRFATGGIAGELAEQGEIAERLGFASFWLPESHFSGDASIPSPLLLLATIAARTKQIRLGTTSYLLPIRQPVQAAEEVAVLDRLSGGRVILGVGRGFQDSLFTVFDIPVSDKRKLFREKLALMRSAWAGEPLPGSTAEQTITLAPLPVQQPHPPIWVAAFGPLAIKQAGSLGLPYIASPVEPIAALADNYQRHRQHALDAGHDANNTVPIMRTLFISDQSSRVQAVRDTLAQESASRIRDQDSDVQDWAIVGDRHYTVDRIAQYREEVGMNYLIARGRIPGVSDAEQIRSHEALLAIAG